MKTLRVYYSERQRLVAADLKAEQEYLAGLGERHSLCQHGPGIVRGLHINFESAERYSVEPGIAIDSRGRELLLSQRATITIDEADKCADLWLVYCRQPLRLRQPGRSACSPETFQRWTEIPRVVVVAAETESSPEPPVGDAVYLGRINCAGPQPIAYTALHGGEVTDPGGRALMQVGPRVGRETDRFALLIADAMGNLTKRLVIDRRENNTLSGTLELLGYHQSLIIPVPQTPPLFLLIEPAKLGEQVLLELNGTELPDKVEMSLKFRRVPDELAPEQVLFNSADSERDKKLQDFNATSNLVRLSILTEFPPLRGQTIRLQSLSALQQSSLIGWGGIVELDDWPEQDKSEGNLHAPVEKEKRYGCYDAPESVIAGDSVEPAGLSFLPVAQPIKGEPLPRIYSAVVTSGDRTIEQLRLDLGEKKDVDFSERLTIGAWPDGNDKFVALTINGKSRLSLTSENPSVPDTLVSMKVDGFIEQTIKPDPTDPVFSNLLIAAYTYGLRSSSLITTNITVSIQNLPNPLLIETGKPWHYDVHIRNEEATTVNLDLLLETLGTDLPKPLRTNVEIPSKQSFAHTVNHGAGEVAAGDLDIKIIARGTADKVPWVKEAPVVRIPVVETPHADLSDVPDSVPPLSEWSYVLSVENLAERGMTLLQVIRTEGEKVEPALPVPVALPAHQTKQFGPFAHMKAIMDELEVSLFVRYRWDNGPEEIITSELRTIKFETQLEIDVLTPDEIEISQPWDFSLAFENTSTKAIEVILLEQRIVQSVDDQDTPFVAISNLPAILNPNDIITLESIPGLEVPPAAAQVTLQILAAYQRDGRVWRTQPPGKTIAVVAKP